ncbi:hypothetical protein ZHAS_00008759 [Anopheles sinensis]|uniref:Sodium/solute symporter n=1 Tax=Anopheles sinensis TaxID=74873 RepID=A0A084VTA1_ANOSI|nr:hypothetical protein ZHAS_00008759 [Anopheles sinensis]
MATELEDIVEHMRRFAWPDYLVFVSMLLLCIFIGVYFGFVQKKPNTESEYLMGGRTMLVFPIALSLIASFISGITLLGLPTEVYSFGIQYVYVALGVTLMGFVMGFIYLPVFHKLNITSTYELFTPHDGYSAGAKSFIADYESSLRRFLGIALI